MTASQFPRHESQHQCFHLSPSRTTVRETGNSTRAGWRAPLPLAQRGNPQNQTQHQRPALRKRGSNRCTEPHKVTWVGQTPGGHPPSHIPHKAQAGVPLPRDEAAVPKEERPGAESNRSREAMPRTLSVLRHCPQWWYGWGDGYQGWTLAPLSLDHWV